MKKGLMLICLCVLALAVVSVQALAAGGPHYIHAYYSPEEADVGLDNTYVAAGETVAFTVTPRGGNAATVTASVCLSLTSIFAFTPLLFSASISREAATAAPPVRSLVFTISTFIALPCFRYLVPLHSVVNHKGNASFSNLQKIASLFQRKSNSFPRTNHCFFAYNSMLSRP